MITADDSTTASSLTMDEVYTLLDRGVRLETLFLEKEKILYLKKLCLQPVAFFQGVKKEVLKKEYKKKGFKFNKKMSILNLRIFLLEHETELYQVTWYYTDKFLVTSLIGDRTVESCIKILSAEFKKRYDTFINFENFAAQNPEVGNFDIIFAKCEGSILNFNMSIRDLSVLWKKTKNHLARYNIIVTVFDVF